MHKRGHKTTLNMSMATHMTIIMGIIVRARTFNMGMVMGIGISMITTTAQPAHVHKCDHGQYTEPDHDNISNMVTVVVAGMTTSTTTSQRWAWS